MTRVADQANKDRSLSVAINTAPEDFALVDPDELCSSGLPVPSLHNVHGLAIVLETSGEGEESDNSEQEEEELVRRFKELKSTSMDDADFQQKVKDLRKMEIRIEIMLKEFTPDHVTTKTEKAIRTS